MNTDIHRLLDEAFAGVTTTPDAQDLKEEIRANLMSRVAELEASGISSSDAAARAIAELGDLRELVDDAAAPGSGAGGAAQPDGAPAPAPLNGYTALALRNRVRPEPGFVVRTVVWSLAIVVGVTLATLGATGVLPLVAGPLIALLGVASTGLGLLVGDALAQETTGNHPMPQNRAGGYGLASFLALYGLGFAGLVGLRALPLWCVVFAALGVIAAVILFAFLGATQTNRHKAWTRQARAQLPQNRFEQEPETAARFGIYVAAIWLLTFLVIAVLGFTISWWWAPVAFVAGVAAMMLLLARMLFGPRKKEE